MSKSTGAPSLSVVQNSPTDDAPQSGFTSEAEKELSRKFLEDGHVVVPVEDLGALDRLRDAVASSAAHWLDASTPKDPGALLDSIHARLGPTQVNDMRMSIINGLNTQDWVARDYFSVARKTIESVVGNELAMQRRLNLSVQMPGDDSSVLPVHADVWDGNSPFEVVLWVPLVDCYGTKAMFLLLPKANAKHEADFRRFADKSVEDLFHAIEPDVIWPEVRYGEAMVFSLSLMHGNRVNFEAGTRWSFNCRFKSLFSPYGDKRLGEFFEPITIRAATRMGMDYTHLEGFDE